jgi:hypothetical protein
MVGIYFTKNNMTVLQIHEELAFAVISFFSYLIGTKSLFESLDLTPKTVSKYFNKVRTGHKFVGPDYWVMLE